MPSATLKHLNSVVGKVRQYTQARHDKGVVTTLEDSLEIVQLELESLTHTELVELSRFCVGICVVLGPTKILGIMEADKQSTKEKRT
jgi:hypothetical protein